MDSTDKIYLWKQYYWNAIEEGLEPWEATQFANRSLSRDHGPLASGQREAAAVPA